MKIKSFAVERLLAFEETEPLTITRTSYGHVVELVMFRRRMIVDISRKDYGRKDFATGAGPT